VKVGLGATVVALVLGTLAARTLPLWIFDNSSAEPGAGGERGRCRSHLVSVVPIWVAQRMSGPSSGGRL
jgi:hypothetical protein